MLVNRDKFTKKNWNDQLAELETLQKNAVAEMKRSSSPQISTVSKVSKGSKTDSTAPEAPKKVKVKAATKKVEPDAKYESIDSPS
jgi:hypothetical protein